MVPPCCGGELPSHLPPVAVAPPLLPGIGWGRWPRCAQTPHNQGTTRPPRTYGRRPLVAAVAVAAASAASCSSSFPSSFSPHTKTKKPKIIVPSSACVLEALLIPPLPPRVAVMAGGLTSRQKNETKRLVMYIERDSRKAMAGNEQQSSNEYLSKCLDQLTCHIVQELPAMLGSCIVVLERGGLSLKGAKYKSYTGTNKWIRRVLVREVGIFCPYLPTTTNYISMHKSTLQTLEEQHKGTAVVSGITGLGLKGTAFMGVPHLVITGSGGERPLHRKTTTEPFNCKTVPVKALPSQDCRKDPESLGGRDFGSTAVGGSLKDEVVFLQN
ncbi:UNVERIFIED_CONTAM: hypothetical protein FKN15_053557 [Acipenser sinensis]